ncbi:MAG TPA: oligopeptide:H+ symporter, partial [Polyangiaceae bacterium]|nr:oligopeptide:H+ symporter [Polyangiaceae bacterium]
FLYCSLGVVVVGNGLFKANAGNLVRKIYEGDDAKIDSAFTMYYMAVNIGSTISILLCPWIKDRWGWNWAFGVCCGGLVLGLVNYIVMQRTLMHIGSPPDDKPVDKGRLAAVLGVGVAALFVVAYILQHKDVAKGCVYLAGIALLGIFGYLIANSTRSERSGLTAALVLNVQCLLFFVFYQQMATSLSLFALRNVNADFSIFGIHLFDWLPAQFQALNAIWIMVLSPVLAWLYTYFGNRGKDISIAAKFAVGFAVVAVGFFIYGVGRQFAVEGRCSSWIMVWGYGFYSLGELLVSGLGLAMIARYVPARMGGFMMGGYFVVTGISQYLGSVVANFASVPKDMTDPVASLSLYSDLFNKLGYVAVGGTLLAIALLPLMKRLSDTHSGHATQAKAEAKALAAE